MNANAHRGQAGGRGGYGAAAAAHNKSLSMHRWANWIAGFSGEFARSAILRHARDEWGRYARDDWGRDYHRGQGDLGRFLSPGETFAAASDGAGAVVMDPFAGVGTTLIEANRLGLDCIGFEINPFAALVCRVKLGAADVCLRLLRDGIAGYAGFMDNADGRNPHSSPPAGFKSRVPFFSPAVERKVLLTLDYIRDLPASIQDIFRVAFASVMVEFSNYSYEPSLGTRAAAGKALVDDAPVGGILVAKLGDMTDDIAEFQRESGGLDYKPGWRIYERSFFDADSCLDAASVDLIVTSPPYMNNYHYVRNSRPQLFWSGLVQSPSELKRLETGNFGKFWQTVRNDAPIALMPQLPVLESEIAEIREINGDRGVYGGNGWANYVTAYMNDLDKFCELLARILKPGATAVIVVGNSIVQGREIKVEERLCNIAELRGLAAADVTILRERVGSSIINSGARLRSKSKSALYDAAVVIRRPV